MYRFRLGSGLPVGGWGVCELDPDAEAGLASSLVQRYGLDFYVANPEVEYEFSGADGPSPERSGRSRRFVPFRALRPAPFPARRLLVLQPEPSRHRLGLLAAGGLRLPPSGVRERHRRGRSARVVRRRRARLLPPADVHPTIGMAPGRESSLDVATYVELLAQAGTVGFSVYLAETRMDRRRLARPRRRDHGARGIALSCSPTRLET